MKTTGFYFDVYDKAMGLEGDDHVTLWLKEKVQENHEKIKCGYTRRMFLYAYVRGAVKKGLDPDGFELALKE